jgi:hypothetical protein
MVFSLTYRIDQFLLGRFVDFLPPYCSGTSRVEGQRTTSRASLQSLDWYPYHILPCESLISVSKKVLMSGCNVPAPHAIYNVKADNQYSCQRVYQCITSQPGLGNIRVIARLTVEAG